VLRAEARSQPIPVSSLEDTVKSEELWISMLQSSVNHIVSQPAVLSGGTLQVRHSLAKPIECIFQRRLCLAVVPDRWAALDGLVVPAQFAR